ncbi:MAG TPA: T9SS type A sorting domain-containing protein, partial [Candidatus Kapabacteria bacterium]|nr:T9SS type A sorting domain-containing protein [Candidatus Kapabacteria bacterium]
PCALWSELPKPGVERVHLTVCAQPLTAGILAEAKFMPLVNQKDTIFSSVMIDSIQFYPTATVLPSGCSVPFTIIPLCGLAGVSFANTTSLAQNYPNPFTGTTTIHVTLSQTDANGAQLKVYNMLGEEVADLTCELSPNTDIPFTAERSKTGVYYYVLQTASGRLTRQMFVVK